MRRTRSGNRFMQSVCDMLLKHHYLPDDHKRKIKEGTKDEKWVDKPLGDLIVLAEKKYEKVWKPAQIKPRVDRANDILHDYSRQNPMSSMDDKYIRDFLLTLKTLIEQVPKPQ